MKLNTVFVLNRSLDRKLFSIWILWALVNLCFMIFFGHPSGKLYFTYTDVPYDGPEDGQIYQSHQAVREFEQCFYYPYGKYGKDVYDYTEFLFYTIVPLGLFFAKRIAFPRNPSSDENRTIKTETNNSI